MAVKPHDDVDLLNIFAHDLKAPLGAIKGYVELVEHSGELNEQQQMFCDKAFASIDRMQNMIDTLLDYARLDAYDEMRIVDCDVHALIAEVMPTVTAMAESREIEIFVDIDPSLSPIQGDPTLLNHVFSNLLTNAVKYNRDEGEVFVMARSDGAYIRLDVRDTGEGIAPDQINQIFDRFYRVDRKRKPGQPKIDGTGLGLSIVRSVVQKHGGSIEVNSTVGEGSTFTVRLPRADMDSSGDDRVVTISEGLRKDSVIQSVQPHEVARESLDDIDDNLQDHPEVIDNDSEIDTL